MHPQLWPLLSLFAAACWAIVNVADKKLVTSRFPQFTNYFLIESIFGLLIAVAAAALRGVTSTDLTLLGIMLITGVLEGLFTLLYYRALQLADVSVVAILLQLIPAFSVVLGVTFLGEHLDARALVALTLIIVACGMASWEPRSSEHRPLSNAFLLMTLASLCVSVAYGIQVFALRSASANTVFVMRHVGQACFAAILLLSVRVRKPFLSLGRQLSPYTLGVVLGLILLNLIGVYMQTVAFEMGTLAAVSTLSSTQPVFVIIFVVLINRIIPDAIPDENTLKYLGLRIAAVVLTVMGIALLES